MSTDPSDEDTPEFWEDLRWAIAERASLQAIEPDTSLYDFDGYEAMSTIVGGMGLIIIARDPKLDRKVALKLWKTSGPAAEAALLAEAKTLAMLSHPNVVTVYDVRKFEDSVYFVMECVDGMDGRKWLEPSRTWQEIRDVFVDAGLGLAAAHDAGIQHGDFKPANMLVGSDGRTRVADFGVADTLRSIDDDDEAFAGVRGTPDYMAPERLRGERGDARSDQFSFCVSMWRALHGLRLYGGESVFQLLDAIESGSIRGGDVAVPHWLSRVLRKGLAEDPELRFADMHELVRALDGEPPGEESRAEERDEGDAVEDDVRVLHAPAQRASGVDDRARLAMITSGIVAVVAVFALTLVCVVLVLHSTVTPTPTALPTPAELPRSEPLRDSTTRAQRGVTPEQVIELVEAGRLEEAEAMWRPEHRRRQDLGVPVYPDTARIGEACLELAREHEQAGRIEEASTAASVAELFGDLAIRDFEIYATSTNSDEGPVDAGSNLVRRARQFKSELRP